MLSQIKRTRTFIALFLYFKIAPRLSEEDHDYSWIDSFPTHGSGAADVTRFKAASDATLAFPGLVSYLHAAQDFGLAGIVDLHPKTVHWLWDSVRPHSSCIVGGCMSLVRFVRWLRNCGWLQRIHWSSGSHD